MPDDGTGAARPIGDAPVLRVRGLSRSYGGRPVVDGLDLDVGRGEVVALVGPNGAGKTTALRCVVGAESRDAGEVLLGQHPLDTRQPQARRALCTVLGDAGVLPDLTVAEHLDLLARAHGVGDGLGARGGPAASSRDAAVEEVVAAALDEARIAHVADQVPGTLSSGQAQRLALASAMVRPWALLVADEPEQRLDDAGRDWLAGWLAGHASRGRSVLLACHDAAVVAGSGARVVELAGD